MGEVLMNGNAVVGERRVRPSSAAAHYARMLTPDALEATRMLFEGEKGARARQVADKYRAGRSVASGRSSSMRGLVVQPGGRWSWRKIPAPGSPGPGAAVVRPIAVATCDADRAIMLGKTPFPLPLHLGHECVAEVVQLGEGVETVAAGDRVVVPFQISCGECAPCTQGHPGSCATVPKTSMYGFGLGGGFWGGVLSDLVAVPYADAMLVPLPEGIDPVAAASVADNVQIAYEMVAPDLPSVLAADPDAEVLFIGNLKRKSPFTASTFMYAGLIAKALGARNVSMVDARPGVRAHAERLGLRALGPNEREWPVAAITVDSTATGSGLRRVLRHTAPDGYCVCGWSMHRRLRFPMSQSYLRGVTFRIGRTHARRNIPEVLRLMVDGRLHPEVVTTNVASFDDAPAALREHCSENAVKTILVADG